LRFIDQGREAMSVPEYRPPPSTLLTRMRHRTLRVGVFAAVLVVVLAAFLIFAICACQTFR
jgi:hypothetical protein